MQPKDETTAGFTVTIGRDENGNTTPMIIVKTEEIEMAVIMDRGAAREFALELLAAEASCGGRQILALDRIDGNFNA